MSEEYNIPEPNSLDSMEGVETKPMDKIESGELDEKSKEHLREAIKSIEGESPRIDNAVYYLINTKNIELIKIASHFFKYYLLEQIETIRNTTSMFRLLHTPKHAAVSFIRYILDKEENFYSKELDSLLDQETRDVGTDLVLLLIIMEEFSGAFERYEWQSEFNSRIIGSEQYDSIRNKSKKIPSNKKGDDASNYPEIKEMIDRIIRKYSTLNIPTEDEINSYIQGQLPKLKKILGEN